MDKPTFCVSLASFAVCLGCLYYTRDQANTAREQLKIMQAATTDRPAPASGEPSVNYYPIWISTGTLLASMAILGIIAIKTKPSGAPPVKASNLITPSRLEIHSATWWNQRRTVSRDVLREVKEKLSTDGWVFRVDTFGNVQDPEEGDDHKYVEIDYTFDGWDRRVNRWEQRSFVVLPEDPRLYSQKTTDQTIAKNKELLRFTPRVFVTHRRYDPDKQCDVLSFTHDKDGEARYIRLEPVTVTLKHQLVAQQVIPPVMGGGPAQECRVVVCSGATQQLGSLYATLRDSLPNSQQTTRVYYKDENSVEFYREFTLKEDPATQLVTWEGGSVCPAEGVL
jgi:hypothetical protein